VVSSGLFAVALATTWKECKMARKMLESDEPEEFFCRLSIAIDLPRSFL
jgi:hypothetical protein